MSSLLRNGLTFLRDVTRRLDPIRGLATARRRYSNWRRRRFRDLDWVLLALPAAMPALPEPRSFLQRRLFGPPPVSLWELETVFERIASDPRPKGVVLSLSGLELSLADLQTLREQIVRLRGRGKRVVAHGGLYDMAQYLIASACDEVLLQPNGDLAVTGLASEAFFLKDALAQVGVQVDVIAISPYKSAFEQFSSNEISPESREQIEWLLDSRYDQFVRAIAEGRGRSEADIRALIDGGPYLDDAALAAGLVDALVYEDELPARFGVKRLVPWDKARRMLLHLPPKPYSDRAVAVLSITGMMVPGESGGVPGDIPLPVPVPFLGEDRAGDVTIVQQARALMRDESIGAVVVFIDSGGGAVSAAANMGQALDALAATRPVVAYMNGVAASGGYWVATSAQHIVAQPGTITGSIGVITAKPVAGGLLAKFQVNAARFKRGANADLYDVFTPFSEAQRDQVRSSIEAVYQRFVARTAKARGLTEAQVDAVGGGRVWTGEQALQHGLVDSLGGLRDAIAKARALADLPEHTPTIFWYPDEPVAPQVIEPVRQAARSISPLTGLAYVWETALLVANGRAQAILPFWFR